MKYIYYLTPFIFAVMPVCFLYVKNIAEVKTKKLFKNIFYFTVAYLILLFAMVKFFSDIKFISLTLLSFVYLFYNLSQLINKIIRKKLVKKLTYSLCIATSIILPFILSKYNIDFFIKTLFFVSLSILILFLLAAIRSINALNNKKRHFKENQSSTNQEVSSNNNLPNIYYFVVDTYTDNNILKTYFNYDNSDFTNWLENNNFKVFKNAKSNYMMTHTSIASTLNMDYLSKFCKIDEKMSTDEVTMLCLYNCYLKNKVIETLKSNGYEYHHLLNWWEKQMLDVNQHEKNTICKDITGTYEFEKCLYSKTIIGFIVDKIIKNLSKKVVLDSFDYLETIADDSNNKVNPKFIFTHLICPHDPFYFDENGKTPKKNLDQTKENDYKKLYVGQVKYLNKRLEKIIANILKQDNNSIIIIQADHGSGTKMTFENCEENPSNEAVFERFSIFRAIYTPFKNIDLNFVSSVNLFRILFNKLFNSNLQILEDEYYYSSYTEGYRYNKIHKIEKEIIENRM